MAIGSSDQGMVVEALKNVESATPHRDYAPELVLALRVARHQGSGAYPMVVEFKEQADEVPGLPVGDELGHPRTIEPITPSEGPWRFAVALDIRDPLRLGREVEILWSQHAIPAAWLDRLLASVKISGNHEHRVIVYAVVEVTGPTMRVQQSAAVVPRCCCNGQLRN